MKKLIIYILFIILGLNELKSEDFGTWKIIDTVALINDSFFLYDEFEMQRADSNNCIYFVGFSELKGNIIRATTDGGNSWITSFADTVSWPEICFCKVIRDISYPSKELAIAVADSGTILRSTDSGLSWIKQQYDTLLNFRIIEMYDENEGFVLSRRNDSLDPEHAPFVQYRFWKTYNGGIDWVEEYRPILNEFRENKWTWALQLQILSKDLGMSHIDVTEDNKRYWKILKIYDDWTSWDTVSRPISHYKHFVDEQTGWVASSSEFIDPSGNKKKKQLIYHTTDGGLTWETQRYKYFYNLVITDIKFYDKNFGIAGTENRFVLMTSDGGKTWHEINILEYPPDGFHQIRNISIPTPNVAYMYSSLPNEILKWTRTPTSVVEDFSESEFVISPNPATDYIEINNYMLSEAKEPVIKIYDVLGIEHPATAWHPSTEGNSVRIDISALPKGVYFVKVGGKVSKFVKM